jgi:hypothetical protein
MRIILLKIKNSFSKRPQKLMKIFSNGLGDNESSEPKRLLDKKWIENL